MIRHCCFNNSSNNKNTFIAHVDRILSATTLGSYLSDKNSKSIFVEQISTLSMFSNLYFILFTMTQKEWLKARMVGKQGGLDIKCNFI